MFSNLCLQSWPLLITLWALSKFLPMVLPLKFPNEPWVSPALVTYSFCYLEEN